jgi:hypothetical protein
MPESDWVAMTSPSERPVFDDHEPPVVVEHRAQLEGEIRAVEGETRAVEGQVARYRRGVHTLVEFVTAREAMLDPTELDVHTQR